MRYGSHEVFRLHLLGSFEVWLPGGQRLGSPRTRKGDWLLALLALRTGQTLPRDWLSGIFWPESDEEKALYNLRRCLSDLRTLLGDQEWRLASPTTRTLMLDLTDGFVDVPLFDAAIAQGTEETLQQALALYRGPLLEGCDEGWVFPERSVRAENYLAALERLAQIAAESGDLVQSTVYLREIISREPTREAAQRSLMEMLARNGDFAEAVQVYRSLRIYLRSELNTAPAAETQRVHEQIRKQARAIVLHPLGAGEPGRVRSIGSVTESIAETIAAGRAAAESQPPWEPAGGAMSLESRFYIERSTDEAFFDAIRRRDSIVLVKGPRQVGKTSLLSRGLQSARDTGQRVAAFDFQKLSAVQRESPDSLYRAMCYHLYERLELETPPADVWNADAGPNENLERYLRRHVLKVDGQEVSLVWGFDEIDVLFEHSYSSEVFALFRSWHNERSLDPDGPWARLTLCIAFATEAHLFITDLNQSPFNVGTRLALDDFTPNQVAELAQRYGGLLTEPWEKERFHRLVGGHPYLVRRGLDELRSGTLSLGDLEAGAANEESPFSDHLHRVLFFLRREGMLEQAVREVLENRPCPAGEAFYRLRSAGVILGDAPELARLRCGLYASYLGSHLR